MGKSLRGVQLTMEAFHYFPSSVYVAQKPEFLESVTEVSEEALSKITHDVHELYPMHNTDNYVGDPRLVEFVKCLWQNGWDILQSQGYAMDNFNVVVDAVWTQEHHKHSLMEQHVHGGGDGSRSVRSKTPSRSRWTHYCGQCEDRRHRTSGDYPRLNRK